MTEINDVNPDTLNAIALAYLGDSVYEVYIREFLITSGIVRPKQLQNTATHYVSAKAQAALVTKMQDDNLLREDEVAVFLRGRNAKSYTHAKNTKLSTYNLSTGFEAIFGYLKLKHDNDRIELLARWCIEQVMEDNLHEYRFE